VTIAVIDQLAATRREQRLTRVALAARLGVTAAALGQWEAGTSRPTIDNLDRWARLLGRNLGLTPTIPGLAAWAHNLPAAVVADDGPLVELMGAEQ
jgi:transcriptional regulator with XRE-family HTH domain